MTAEEYFYRIKFLAEEFCKYPPMMVTFEEYLNVAIKMREVYEMAKEFVKEDRENELSKLYEMALDKFFSA